MQTANERDQPLASRGTADVVPGAGLHRERPGCGDDSGVADTSLNSSLASLISQCEHIGSQLRTLQAQLEDAKKAWPDHQMRCRTEWYDRSVTPPKGYIWASDGVGVWLIRGKGEPISETATAVKFWTAAYIPAPPEFIKGDRG